MKQKRKIGELIKEEVEKKGLSAEDFGNEIFCSRTYVYKIYKKASIDTALLARISTALGRDFFRNISEDMALSGVDDEKAQQEIYNRMAVTQFLEVVPDLLGRLGKPSAIFVASRPSDFPSEWPMPDYYIGEFSPLLLFSVGDTMRDKIRNIYNEDIKCMYNIIPYTEEKDGITANLIKMNCNGPDMLDIKLDYKTEQEWEKLFRFIFDNIVKGRNELINKYEICWK